MMPQPGMLPQQPWSPQQVGSPQRPNGQGRTGWWIWRPECQIKRGTCMTCADFEAILANQLWVWFKTLTPPDFGLITEGRPSVKTLFWRVLTSIWLMLRSKHLRSPSIRRQSRVHPLRYCCPRVACQRRWVFADLLGYLPYLGSWP